MNPGLLQEALENRARIGKLPKAVIVVHLFGQSADIDPILQACNQYDIPLIRRCSGSIRCYLQRTFCWYLRTNWYLLLQW
ncbi:DegT/DnrJ/EryC1/StrS aminotransferase [Fischerella sp. NIES-3754]|nr:DegT/DnrJ/EryC1/StrS aminotransferase [Fischerella sp. NIES-3754]BCX10657.1 MAG: hypothetical protein KatS3mg066_4516 [Fischerella sp.]